MESKTRADFETAMGEAFADAVCPPVPFEQASPHECCEAIHEVIGPDVTPTVLASLSGAKLEELAAGFGRYFECASPAIRQMEDAIARSLARWPVSSEERGPGI